MAEDILPSASILKKLKQHNPASVPSIMAAFEKAAQTRQADERSSLTALFQNSRFRTFARGFWGGFASFGRAPIYPVAAPAFENNDWKVVGDDMRMALCTYMTTHAISAKTIDLTAGEIDDLKPATSYYKTRMPSVS